MLLVNIYHSNPRSPSSSSTSIYSAVIFLQQVGYRLFCYPRSCSSRHLSAVTSFCGLGLTLFRITHYDIPYVKYITLDCSHPTLERREHVRCLPAKPIAMTPSPTTCPSEESPFGENFYSGRLIEPVIHLIYNSRRKP